MFDVHTHNLKVELSSLLVPTTCIYTGIAILPGNWTLDAWTSQLALWLTVEFLSTTPGGLLGSLEMFSEVWSYKILRPPPEPSAQYPFSGAICLLYSLYSTPAIRFALSKDVLDNIFSLVCLPLRLPASLFVGLCQADSLYEGLWLIARR